LSTCSAWTTQFAAFYADCAHEVKPIESGFRLAIVYNLCYRPSVAGAVAPTLACGVYDEQLNSLAAVLRDWHQVASAYAAIAAPSCPLPKRLAFMLSHQYVAGDMRFDQLKGRDAAVADVARRACEMSNTLLFVATIDVTHHLDEEAGGEIFDTDFRVGAWVPAFGWSSPPDGQATQLTIKELLPKRYFTEADADSSSHEGPTGNEGSPIERRYHRAALIFVPDAFELDLFEQSSRGAALEALHTWLEEERRSFEHCARLLSNIVDNWQRRDTRSHYDYRYSTTARDEASGTLELLTIVLKWLKQPLVTEQAERVRSLVYLWISTKLDAKQLDSLQPATSSELTRLCEQVEFAAALKDAFVSLIKRDGWLACASLLSLLIVDYDDEDDDVYSVEPRKRHTCGQQHIAFARGILVALLDQSDVAGSVVVESDLNSAMYSYYSVRSIVDQQQSIVKANCAHVVHLLKAVLAVHAEWPLVARVLQRIVALHHSTRATVDASRSISHALALYTDDVTDVQLGLDLGECIGDSTFVAALMQLGSAFHWSEEAIVELAALTRCASESALKRPERVPAYFAALRSMVSASDVAPRFIELCCEPLRSMVQQFVPPSGRRCDDGLCAIVGTIADAKRWELAHLLLERLIELDRVSASASGVGDVMIQHELYRPPIHETAQFTLSSAFSCKPFLRSLLLLANAFDWHNNENVRLALVRLFRAGASVAVRSPAAISSYLVAAAFFLSDEVPAIELVSEFVDTLWELVSSLLLQCSSLPDNIEEANEFCSALLSLCLVAAKVGRALASDIVPAMLSQVWLFHDVWFFVSKYAKLSFVSFVTSAVDAFARSCNDENAPLSLPPLLLQQQYQLDERSAHRWTMSTQEQQQQQASKWWLDAVCQLLTLLSQALPPDASAAQQQRVMQTVAQCRRRFPIGEFVIPACRRLANDAAVAANAVVASSALDVLFRHCIDSIDDRVADALTPKSWRRDVSSFTSCACPHCGEAKQFLADANRSVWHFQAAQKPRAHVEQAIPASLRRHLSFETQKPGRSRHVLVITKKRTYSEYFASYSQRSRTSASKRLPRGDFD
jgi:hypothetical protein